MTIKVNSITYFKKSNGRARTKLTAVALQAKSSAGGYYYVRRDSIDHCLDYLRANGKVVMPTNVKENERYV